MYHLFLIDAYGINEETSPLKFKKIMAPKDPNAWRNIPFHKYKVRATK